MYKFNKKEETNIEKGSSASIFHVSHFVKALIVELLQLQQNKTAKCDPYYFPSMHMKITAFFYFALMGAKTLNVIHISGFLRALDANSNKIKDVVIFYV